MATDESFDDAMRRFEDYFDEKGQLYAWEQIYNQKTSSALEREYDFYKKQNNGMTTFVEKLKQRVDDVHRRPGKILKGAIIKANLINEKIMKQNNISEIDTSVLTQPEALALVKNVSKTSNIPQEIVKVSNELDNAINRVINRDGEDEALKIISSKKIIFFV